MDAFQILVTILSIFLAIALLLTIIVLVYVIKLVKSVQDISSKAAVVVERASSASKFISPTVAGKFVYDAVNKIVKNHQEGNKKGNHGKK